MFILCLFDCLFDFVFNNDLRIYVIILTDQIKNIGRVYTSNVDRFQNGSQPFPAVYTGVKPLQMKPVSRPLPDVVSLSVLAETHSNVMGQNALRTPV